MRIRNGYVRCEGGERLAVSQVHSFKVEKLVDGRYAAYAHRAVGQSKITREYQTEDEAQTALDDGVGWDE